MSKFTDILRKLGIFRSGAISWSGKAKDRKIEMIMPDVLNSKKDLMTNSKSGNSVLYLKIVLIMSILIAIFILLIFTASGSFGLWFWLNLIVWAAFIYYLYKALKTNKFKLKNIIGILMLLTVISLFSLTAIAKVTKDIVNYDTVINPTALVDMGIDLENTLKLDAVSVNEVAGGIVEIRTKTPANVSSDSILLASAYIFSYVDPSLPPQIKTIRVILTLNDFDATVIETSRDNLKKYISGELLEKNYIATLKINNLTK